MKKILSLLTAPLLLAGLLFSCKPEQSELNLEALPGTATVTGKVEYNPGVTNIDGVLVKDFKKKAEGRTVEVKIFTESYLNPNDEDENISNNYRTFRGKTDENGRYSISVPVGYQAIPAYVTALPFIDNVNVLDHDKNIVPVENAVYKNEAEGLGKRIYLMDQSIEEVDILMITDKKADYELNQKVSLEGVVKIYAEQKGENTLSDTLVPYATDLRIVVTVGETKLRYETKSDANGQYRLDMLLPYNCWDETTMISVEHQKSLGNCTHYYRKTGATEWESETVQVIVNSQPVEAQLTDNHKLIPVSMPELNLDVDPVNRDQVKGIGNPGDEENNIELHNPLNW